MLIKIICIAVVAVVYATGIKFFYRFFINYFYKSLRKRCGDPDRLLKIIVAGFPAAVWPISIPLCAAFVLFEFSVSFVIEMAKFAVRFFIKTAKEFIAACKKPQEQGSRG